MTNPGNGAPSKRNTASVKSSRLTNPAPKDSNAATSREEVFTAVIASLNRANDTIIRLSRRMSSRRTEEDAIFIGRIDTYLRSLSRADQAIRAGRFSRLDTKKAQTIGRFGDLITAEALNLINADKITFENGSETFSRMREYSDEIERFAFEILHQSLELSEENRRELADLADHARYSSRRLEHSIIEANDELRKLSESMAENSAKVSLTDEALRALREEQSAALRAELVSVQEERKSQLVHAQASVTGLVEEIRESEKTKASDHLAAIEELVDRAKITASIVANDKIAKYYSQSAKDEIRSSRMWTGVALSTGLLIVGLVTAIIMISIFKTAENTFAAVIRILAPLIGGPLFIYASLEARQHRRRAWHLTDSAITHNTIGSMIAPLPKEMQNELLLQAARKMYVSATDGNVANELTQLQKWKDATTSTFTKEPNDSGVNQVKNDSANTTSGSP